MARKQPTIELAIRNNRSEYHRLMVQEARLNHELFRLKQRLRKIAQDEEKWLACRQQLTLELQELHQLQADLKQATPSKQRDRKLQKIEKQRLEVSTRYSRNEYHLTVLEKRKFDDNTVKLVLKEAKRDDVRIRAQAAYNTWQYFEQLQQWEAMDLELFTIQKQAIAQTQKGNISKSGLAHKQSFTHEPFPTTRFKQTPQLENPSLNRHKFHSYALADKTSFLKGSSKQVLMCFQSKNGIKSV